MAKGHSSLHNGAMTGISTKVCRVPDDAGCYSVTYYTYDLDYNKACGRVRGYQKDVLMHFTPTHVARSPSMMPMLIEYQ